jgi:two-component system, NarL family, sensor kinase
MAKLVYLQKLIIRYHLLSFIIVTIFALPLFSQGTSKTDSLKSILKTSSTDTTKISILNALSEDFWKQGSYDSSQIYAQYAIDLASSLLSGNQFVHFSKNAITKGYNNVGNAMRDKAEYDNSLKPYAKAVNLGEEILKEYPEDKVNKRILAISYNSIGGINYFKGNYDKALSAYFKALPLFESIGEKPKIASCYNNMGLIQEAKKDYDKAYQFYSKALAIHKEAGNKRGMASCYNNIGSILSTKKNYDSALTYYFMAVNLNKEINNKNWLAFNYENLGNIYEKKNEFDKALAFYSQALDIRKEINEIRGIAISYGSIGNIFFKKGKYNIAKENLLTSLKTTKEINAKPEMIQAYLALAQCDSAMGNYKSALTYHQLYSQTKDSVFNEESSKQLTEMQTKYETEKTENENKLLVNENKISALEVARQKSHRNNLIIGFSLLLIVGLFFFNRNQLINKNKILIEKDLRNKAVLKAQEEEKGRLSQELHDGLGPLLSLIKLNASGVSVNEDNARTIQEIKDLASEGMKEVRTISHALMPSLLQKNGLNAALTEFVDQILSAGIMNVEYVYESKANLSNEAEVNIYRIIQEAVNNSIKYSEATKIYIYLIDKAGKLELVVGDNGKGFEQEKIKKGNGLNNMFSRVEILKGDIQINSKPLKGTKIIISIPQSTDSNVG